MKNIVLLVSTLLASGCAYAPPLPTAPTAVIVAAVPQAVRLALTPSFELGGGVAIFVAAFDELGNRVSVDGSCTATSGAIDPPRILGTAAVGRWRDAAPTRGTVTCTSGGLEASVAIDLSAWTVGFGQFRDELYAAYREDRADPTQWWTMGNLNLSPPTNRPAPTIPTTSVTLSWGDGTVERLASYRTGAASERILHAYKGPGSYAVLARVEWAGGAAEVRGTLTRSCIAQGPIEPLPPPGFVPPYPHCWSAFREER